jgi:LysM repeat protein
MALRLSNLALIPLLGLLSGCTFVHFGKIPPAESDPAVAQENSELRTEKKILQQELTLARKEGEALRLVIESGKSGVGDATLAARLSETTRELAELRGRYLALDAERARLTAAPATAFNPTTPAETGSLTELNGRLSETQEKLAASLRAYTQLREETIGLRAEVMRARNDANILTAQVRNLTVQNEEARAALAQLNTELLAQKDARAKSSQEADAARSQLSTVLTSSRGTPAATLGEARAASAGAASLATLNAPNLPADKAPATARLSTSRERLAAAETAPPANSLRTHIVAPGETLESIAENYYGTPKSWRLIYAANNNQLSLGRPLKVGMVLEIPKR